MGASGYCPPQVSQSNTWQTGNVTWKFSKLKRRLGKKKCGGKKCLWKKAGKKRELGKKGKGKKGKGKKSKKAKKSKKERRLAGCPSDGYWHMHTRNTLKDPNFGPFDCLNAGLPCNFASSASAAKKAIKNAWIKAGGKSYKYMASGYCPSQVSQSNTWQTGNVTWKFSKLKRRLAKKKCGGKKCLWKKANKKRELGKKKKGGKKNKRELGKKKNKKSKKERRLAGCVGGYWAFHTRNTLHDPNFGPFDCLNG